MVRRHREVVRAWMSYMRKGGFPNPIEEPEIPPLRGIAGRPATTLEKDARADILVRGLFREQENAFFDVAVLDTGADFRGRETTSEILGSYEKIKRVKYADRVAPVGSFTPLVCSVYGTLAPEAARTAHRIARRVDPEREERDAVLDLHQVVLQVAILKATSLCLRSRSLVVVPRAARGPGVLEDCEALLGDAGAREEV